MSLLNWLLCALSFAAFGVIKGEGARTKADPQELLLARARQADPEALAELYDQYVDRIYAYVYHRVGQAELAEDLTAQVFMRMLEAIGAGHPWRTSFSGWLYRIAHNLIVDYYRRRQHATFVELDDVAPIQAADGDPLRAAELRSESQRLRHALRVLTEEQSQVITLRFLEEFSIAEVAEMMGKTEGAIKALQYRAISTLKQVMKP